MKSMTPRERILKARVSLLTDYPFFGNLCMKLAPRKLSPEEVTQYNIPALAVDIFGNLLYNPEWVASQDDVTMKCGLCHEVLHLALEHLTRKGTRDTKLWNIAADAVVNEVLSHTFKIPPNWVRMQEADGKSSEEMYDYLVRNAKLIKLIGSGFDTHIYGSGDANNTNNSPFFREGQQPFDATRTIKEAYEFAKQQGTEPAGMRRIFANIVNPVLDWRDILRKYLVAAIPHDFTYTRPSKKTYAAGFYIPTIKREQIEVVIGLDSSGSITNEEYSEFLTEVYSMCRQFDSIKGTLIICDADVQDVIEIDENFDPNSIQGHGYGGTRSEPVYQYIEEHMNMGNVKLLVYFTDGYISIPNEEYPFPTLWIVTKNGVTNTVEKMSNATVIQIPKT